MFDEIRLSQRFKIYNCFISASFRIDGIKKIAGFEEISFIGFEDLNDNLFRKNLAEYKEIIEDKINQKFTLTDFEVERIFNEIDRLVFTDFSNHDFRINSDVHYKIGLFRDGYCEDEIFINLIYADDLIGFNNILCDIFEFPIFELSPLDFIINEKNYDIKRNGIYSKYSFQPLDLKILYFELSSGINSTISWFIDFDSKVLRIKDKTIRVNDGTIEAVMTLIENYGVYNWYYPDYYEKISEKEEILRDGLHVIVKLIFDDDKMLDFNIAHGYPDTYPQLALKIIELFKIDLLKYENLCDIDLYKKYGDGKIMGVEKCPGKNSVMNCTG